MNHRIAGSEVDDRGRGRPIVTELPRRRAPVWRWIAVLVTLIGLAVATVALQAMNHRPTRAVIEAAVLSGFAVVAIMLAAGMGAPRYG